MVLASFRSAVVDEITLVPVVDGDSGREPHQQRSIEFLRDGARQGCYSALCRRVLAYAPPEYDSYAGLNVPATMDKTVSWTACILRVWRM